MTSNMGKMDTENVASNEREMTHGCESSQPHEESIRNGVLEMSTSRSKQNEFEMGVSFKGSQSSCCHTEFHTYGEAKSNA
jgi:hypothetical protein